MENLKQENQQVDKIEKNYQDSLKKLVALFSGEKI